MLFSTLASEKLKATTKTITNLNQILDYLGTHPEATIRYDTSDMTLNVIYDASYPSSNYAQNRAAIHFFLVWKPQDSHPICLNDTIFTIFTIIKFATTSAAESESGALF